jgi:NMD protein affecting ribosome stability and mRNA decay
VVQLTKDKFDILIYNQPRNETFSTIKDGGRVIFIRGSDEEIVFMIMYPETVTVYTIVKTKQGSKVSVIESKNGMMIRTSMFSGSCTFVDWAKFK